MIMEGVLERFVDAQEQAYPRALEELGAGRKLSHWMCFVFPQIAGLGRSGTARFYAISSIDEARAYLRHPTLGQRYIRCVEALQDLGGSDPVPIFGETDARKLHSSLTLFEAAGATPLIGAALDRWFAGERDEKTLKLLAAADDEHS